MLLTVIVTEPTVKVKHKIEEMFPPSFSSTTVVYPEACFEDITDGQIPKDQLQLAEQLLKNKTALFDPLLFKDRYQDSLLEVIKAKIEGVEPIFTRRHLQPEYNNITHYLPIFKNSCLVSAVKTVAYKKVKICHRIQCPSSFSE